MNEKGGGIVRVEFTIDFNLSQEQISEIRKNPLGFAYNHIEVKGFDKNDYNIVRVTNTDIMPYGAYGFKSLFSIF